jgi:hypothetical protein
VADRPRRQPRHPEVFRVTVPSGRKLRIEELYRWIFENSAACRPPPSARLTPLEYMRRRGAFLVEDNVPHPRAGAAARDVEGATVDPASHLVMKNGQAVGVTSTAGPASGS